MADRFTLSGGAGRDRTGDLLNANQALSQLSYSPLTPNRLPTLGYGSVSILIEADWTLAARDQHAQPEARARTFQAEITGAWTGKAATYSERDDCFSAAIKRRFRSSSHCLS